MTSQAAYRPSSSLPSYSHTGSRTPCFITLSIKLRAAWSHASNRLRTLNGGITIIQMQKRSSKRGGARPGAGRKPKEESEAMVPVSIKMKAEQKEKLARLGGAPWVRDKIDRAREPEPKK